METIKPIVPIGNLENIVNNTSLKWIFVGGKGGVGKTTISTSLSILLSQRRSKILIISTDPAHNISDAFNQKIGSQPTLINGFKNLYGLEINPKEMRDQEGEESLSDTLGIPLDEDTKNIFSQLKESIPGVDEAIAIGLLLQVIDKMDYSTVIFDTAPTGHTLRMLNFPQILEEAFSKLSLLKDKLGPVSGLLQNTMGEGFKNLTDMLTNFKTQIEKIRRDFMDKNHTTFIAVCIPEFLSMYETERLIQDLNKSQIDCHNIVINQVLFVNDQNENTECDMCKSRFKMQMKYINQIEELYSDTQEGEDVDMGEGNKKFFISLLPLQEQEVRGISLLTKFCCLLIKK